MDPLKEKIIYHVFEFIDTGNIKDSEIARGYLKDMAKKYHIKIKPQRITNTKQAYKDFIINEKGYSETILKLYNSL